MTDQVGSSGDQESEVERTLGTLATLNPAYALDHEPPATTRSHHRRVVPNPSDADGRMAILLVDDMASAEDVVQEAFAGLYRNWGGLRDRNAAIGYLRTAVVNGSRSMLRRRRTARAHVPPDPGTARLAESLAILSTEHQAVVSALADLAPRQRGARAALLRRAVGGGDRRGHRPVEGHRQIHRQPGGGQARRHHAVGALVTDRSGGSGDPGWSPGSGRAAGPGGTGSGGPGSADDSRAEQVLSQALRAIAGGQAADNATAGRTVSGCPPANWCCWPRSPGFWWASARACSPCCSDSGPVGAAGGVTVDVAGGVTAGVAGGVTRGDVAGGVTAGAADE